MTHADARATTDGWYRLLEGVPHEDRIGHHHLLGVEFFHNFEAAPDGVFVPPLLQFELEQHTDYRISSAFLEEVYSALWAGETSDPRTRDFPGYRGR